MFAGFNNALKASNSLSFVFARGSVFAFTGGSSISVSRLVLSLVSFNMRSRCSRRRGRRNNARVAVCNSPGSFSRVRGRLRRYNFRMHDTRFAHVPGSLGSIGRRRHTAVSGVMRHLRRSRSMRGMCAGVGPRRWLLFPSDVRLLLRPALRRLFRRLLLLFYRIVESDSLRNSCRIPMATFTLMCKGTFTSGT